MTVENDCFALRFNLQKCGCYVAPDSTAVYAAMFDAAETQIHACLREYAAINAASAAEIGRAYPAAVLQNLFGSDTLLFMGDSITAERMSYGQITAQVLPCKTVDGAVSGFRSTDVLASLVSLLHQHRPTMVSVMVGTNDTVCARHGYRYSAVSREEFAQNLDLIAQTVLEHGAYLVFHSIPPVYPERYAACNDVSWLDEELSAEFNEIVRTCAEKYHALWNPMREIFAAYPKKVIFEPDGLHLSPFAQKLQAESFIKLLVEWKEQGNAV